MDVYVCALCSLLLVLCMFLKILWRNAQKSNRIPPSLPSLPLIGSLPFMSGRSTLHLYFTKQAKRYGDVFSFNVGSRYVSGFFTYVVVLNSHVVLHEALVKRAADFAGRPELFAEKYFLNPQVRSLGSRNYDEQYRKNKSQCLSVMKQFGYSNHSVMERKILAEVYEILHHIKAYKGRALNPDKYLQSCILNVIWNFLFSARFEYGDPQMEKILSSVRLQFSTYHPFLNLFHFFAKVPPFRNSLKDATQSLNAMMKFYEGMILECLNNFEAQDNFVNEYVNKINRGSYDIKELSFIIRDLVGAGTESTANQLNWALVLLGNRPCILQRLQSDIDAVVQKDRFPSLGDKQKLPYLEATILEVMKFRTSGPQGVPHRALYATEVGGYLIPRDAMVITNLWAAHMDPRIWKDPETFRPERFLDENGNVINRELVIGFSLGKQACIGELLARHELFLFLAAMLQQFNILPPEGAAGIREDIVVGIVLSPAAHHLRLVPRHKI